MILPTRFSGYKVETMFKRNSLSLEDSVVEDIDIMSNETVLHVHGEGKDTKTEFSKLSTKLI
ncbi:MAG: hypothetical protein LBV58_04520 [Acholeplasmatales bacterium]|jgi:hypothetical protein|nr:hypothetical protein [Acholeplasmatales bacterium]